jgi:hypothetical protein
MENEGHFFGFLLSGFSPLFASSSGHPKLWSFVLKARNNIGFSLDF